MYCLKTTGVNSMMLGNDKGRGPLYLLTDSSSDKADMFSYHGSQNTVVMERIISPKIGALIP